MIQQITVATETAQSWITKLDAVRYSGKLQADVEDWVIRAAMALTSPNIQETVAKDLYEEYEALDRVVDAWIDDKDVRPSAAPSRKRRYHKSRE